MLLLVFHTSICRLLVWKTRGRTLSAAEEKVAQAPPAGTTGYYRLTAYSVLSWTYRYKTKLQQRIRRKGS